MLTTLLPKEARQLLRDTVHDVANEVVKDAKAKMPRDTGAMAAGTKAYRGKMSSTAITSTVRVVGAYYWRFLEYGDGPDGVEHAFFFRAKEEVQGKLDRMFLDKFSRRLVSRLMK